MGAKASFYLNNKGFKIIKAVFVPGKKREKSLW